MFGTKIQRRGAGGYKPSGVARKKSQLPMAFNPTLVSSPSNITTVLIADNDAHQMEVDAVFDPITHAMAQAKEQL